MLFGMVLELPSMPHMILFFFFFKQKTAYEMLRSLVGSVKEGFFLDTPKAYLLVVIHLLRWMMSQNSSRASSGLGLARRSRELIFTSLNTALRLHRRSQSH